MGKSGGVLGLRMRGGGGGLNFDVSCLSFEWKCNMYDCRVYIMELIRSDSCNDGG